MLVPLVAAILFFAPRQEGRTWAVAFVLQAVSLLGGLAAAAAGEAEALAVQFLVERDLIEVHETAAHLFLVASAATLVAFGVGLFGRPGWRRRAALAALLLGILAAGLGARSGHLGGELVFLHGAVRAHEEAAQPHDP